ncbi:ABC transporter substrate-binding protein [Sandarakinorhabdus sp. AAP62]|uniref:ABC transporter substrate-binding protein n=1 Tax=Sandarakinorhabdus sp. AAP62 TaxID=1248916 RepID=UPI0003673DA4|nr:ABC transporter substrate-binding protein [Sandarakinorhabdus sp. AAP62]
MRSRILPARLVPAIALLLAACSGGRPGGDLDVAVVGEGALAEELAQEASRATLIRRGSAGEVVAGVATSWRFLDDGDDLILRLAPLRWPGAGDRPGRELVALDVALGLRRSGDEGRAALAAAGLARRGTARAPIARVVELAPRPATPLLLDWLAEPALAVRDRRGRLFPGPYTLEKPGEKDKTTLRLQRRSERPLPDARAASIRITPAESAAALSAFAKGEVQLVLGEGLGGLGAARAAGQGRALRLETVPGVTGLAINARSGLLTDVRLRRALLLASDGAPLANRLALALLVPQNRLWDGLPPPTDDRALSIEDRRARAAVLLREVGVGPEQPLRLSLLVPAGPEFRALAETLAANLQPLGISLAVQRARPGGFAVARRNGATDLVLVEQTARVADVVAHLGQWRCARVRPCSAAADRLLDEAAAAGNDLTARQAAAAAAEAALMADPAFIPLLRPVRWALVAGDVAGFQINPLGRHPLGRISRDSR